MDIKIDDLQSEQVICLLEEHLGEMYGTSPEESVHALDVDALRAPELTFFSAWRGDKLMGCVAIKELSEKEAELKSMRTSKSARNQGVASQLLQHAIAMCRHRGYKTLSLETGSDDYFKPARRLYEKFGFEYCRPFGHYQADPFSQFMTRTV